MIASQLHALVALDTEVDREVIEAMLSGEPLSVLDYVDLARLGTDDDGAGDVLIVACVDYTTDVGEYLAAASRHHPVRPVVLLCPAASNGYVADAFGAGVDDIVALPANGNAEAARTMSRQVMFTVEKAVARKRGVAATTTQLGTMICVLGLKGGSGKTLTAANMAVALADAGHRVTIVDLDLQFGDVGLALGLSPERTVYDLIGSGGSLDAEKVEDFLAVHSSGARALLAPSRPDQAGIVTSDFLRDVYAVLREVNDFVIIDTPPSFTPEVIAAVDSSTEVCLVAMLDSLSLKNSKLGLETLERMDFDTDRIRLVLNRADSNVGIGREDVPKILGAQPDVLVPSDRGVTRSINRGEPIVLEHRRSEAAKSFRALAELYIQDARAAGNLPELPAKRRRRLFRRAR
ncbi:MAG TPA: AAA family ATPase [Solirubrobacteraceae bacterium]|jgi:pilus assembly protein CpaE|nr:AAA family ATPase [Solirubrobacteraceae bacterium]